MQFAGIAIAGYEDDRPEHNPERHQDQSADKALFDEVIHGLIDEAPVKENSDGEMQKLHYNRYAVE